MDENFLRISGTLCNILRLANDQISTEKPENYLINDFDLISGLLLRKCRSVRNLALDVREEWKQSDYILHALFWALRKKTPMKILENMSGDKIVKLQDAISHAKDNVLKPTDEDTKAASQLCAEYIRRNSKPSAKPGSVERAKNDTIRYSASLTITVAKYWDDMIKEIDKWSDAVDERVSVDGLDNLRKVHSLNLPLNPTPVERKQPIAPIIEEAPVEKKENNPGVVPIVKKQEEGMTTPTVPEPELPKKSESGVFFGDDGDELWTIELLAQKLGLANAGSFYSKKTMFLKTHPEEEERVKSWFSGIASDKKLLLFRAKCFDELNQLMPMRVRSDSQIVSTPSGDLWTSEKLAQELGLSGKAYFQILKSKMLKAHPEYRKKMDLWFSGNGALFDPKYFDDLKEIFPMKRRKTSSSVPLVSEKTSTKEQPEYTKDDLWTLLKLARELGYKDITSVQVKKVAYLKKHPDEETQKFFEKCFVYTHDGKKRAWFVARYFEELKQYIPPVNRAKPADVIKDDQGKELWKSDKLAKVLGFNSTDYFLARKFKIKQQNPDIEKWFVRRGYAVYFYAEHLEELKAALQPIVTARKDVIIDEENKELWSTEKIAAELGLVNETCFFNRKSRLLKRYPEAKNYFVRMGNTVYFKSEYFDVLKGLLQEIGDRSDQTKDKIVQTSVETQPTEQIIIKQPTDMVSLQALDVMLTELQKRYEAALKDKKAKETTYNNLFEAVERAEQELNQANQYVIDLEDNIAKAKKLSQSYAEISQFLSGITTDQER